MLWLIKYTCVVILACAVVAGAWETEAEAAQQVRHLLQDPKQHYNQGVLSTIFPSTYPDATYTHSPLASPEYFAPCSHNGDLTFLALTVSQNWRNALTPGANATFTIQSNPNPSVPDWRHVQGHHWDPTRPQWRRGMPSKLRANLFGYVEVLKDQDDDKPTPKEAECFLKHHPDARKWAPGAKESPHHAKWIKFRVQKIYATGGFGDEHRIGNIDRDVYALARAEADVHVSGSPLQAPHIDELFADNSHKHAHVVGGSPQQVFSL